LPGRLDPEHHPATTAAGAPEWVCVQVLRGASVVDLTVRGGRVPEVTAGALIGQLRDVAVGVLDPPARDQGHRSTVRVLKCEARL